MQLTSVARTPSGLSLVLSALLSVGAAQGLRNWRRVSAWAAVPDWYHTDAVQVGHTTPLPIEFSLAALPACCFDAPLDLVPRAPSRSVVEEVALRLSQFTPPNRIPRGPPR